MRILHIIPNLSGGGAERQLSYLAPELARMGHEVHIAYSKEGPNYPDLQGVALHQIGAQSNYDPYLLWQLFRITHRIQPNIIHTWILQSHIIGGLVTRLAGVPWVLRESSSADCYPPTWKNRLQTRAGSAASAIVSNSLGGDEYWKAHVPHSRRYVIPNGLPLEEIDGALAGLPPGLAKPETPIVLYVGRMIALKNLKVFLEILASVRQKHSVWGILCGDGPQRSELEILRHSLCLDETVDFTGYLPGTSVLKLIKSASLFVSLSSYEGCPNAVIEAMACGCPLVLSDIPAHREIVDESCALFVDPSNIAQASETILQALCNSDASKARALIAKQKTQEWSIAKMARNYERIYQEILDHPSIPGRKRRKATDDQRSDS